MPVEAKPLFRPDVLRVHLQGFDLPPRGEQVRAKLAQWAEIIRGGRVDVLNERELLPDFLTDLFVALLGYEGPPGRGGVYTLSREKYVEVEGQFVDAVLGRFAAGRVGEFVAAVEGKGPKEPLERPYGGRRMSAVDQGYKYAVNLPCDWVVVTNIRQTRLYDKGADQHTYERFDTERLSTDPAHLKKVSFLLGVERVLPPGGGRCHLYDLPHMKDEAMSPVGFLMEQLPVAQPSPPQRAEAESAVRRLIEITASRQSATRTILDWLRVEFDVAKPTLKLQAPAELDADAFVAEVRKARGKGKTLTAAALKALRDEHAGIIAPARALAAEASALERRLSELVNAAYGLTPDDVRLMWETAPPRMPLTPPR